MDMLGLLFSNAGMIWISPALLVCMFWAAMSRPTRINNTSTFRIATYLLAASLVLPIVFQIFVLGNAAANPNRMGDPGNEAIAMYLMVIPPILMTVAAVLAIDSVMPRHGAREAQPTSEFSPSELPRT